MMIRRLLTLAAPLLCLGSALLAGNISVAPAGLNPGDVYRLVFVTSQTTNATSADISTYNQIVANSANSNAELAALGTTWSAIGSTNSVSALSNIGGPDSAAIYNLSGLLVANGVTGTTGLFNSNQTIINYISTDQNGNTGLDYFVWAGTDTVTGLEYMSGANPFGLGTCGSCNSTNGPVYGRTLTFGNWLGFNAGDNTQNFHLYGISGDIVYQPTPEPSSLALMFGACCALALAGRKRTASTNRG